MPWKEAHKYCSLSKRIRTLCNTQLWRKRIIEEFGENELENKYYQDDFHNYLAARFRYLSNLDLSESTTESIFTILGGRRNYGANTLEEALGEYERGGPPFKWKDMFEMLNKYNEKNNLPFLVENSTTEKNIERRAIIRYAPPVIEYIPKLQLKLIDKKQALASEKLTISRLLLKYLLSLPNHPRKYKILILRPGEYVKDKSDYDNIYRTKSAMKVSQFLDTINAKENDIIETYEYRGNVIGKYLLGEGGKYADLNILENKDLIPNLLYDLGLTKEDGDKLYK